MTFFTQNLRNLKMAEISESQKSEKAADNHNGFHAVLATGSDCKLSEEWKSSNHSKANLKDIDCFKWQNIDMSAQICKVVLMPVNNGNPFKRSGGWILVAPKHQSILCCPLQNSGQSAQDRHGQRPSRTPRTLSQILHARMQEVAPIFLLLTAMNRCSACQGLPSSHDSRDFHEYDLLCQHTM